MKYLIFFLFILFLNGCITNSNHSLEKILMEDFEANMIDAIIDNSEIVISTKGIEKVTKLGIAESPRIIKIMEKTNDFNLFVRCFCALQRIHNKRFEWSGGLEAKVVNGSLVFYNPILEAIGEFKSFKNQILDNLKAKIKK